MTTRQICQDLKDGKITPGEAARLLGSVNKQDLKLKVSQKGAISVYGLQRFPVTFYVEQWDRLLAVAGEIREFAKKHAAELTLKGDKPAEPKGGNSTANADGTRQLIPTG